MPRSVRYGRGWCVVVLGAVVLALATPGPTSGASGHASRQRVHGVGVISATYVDHQPTPAWGTNPERSQRTLVTTIFYPAPGRVSGPAIPGAPPDRTGGPYPLIVFAHGLGADPADYETLLTYWASAGFVVAAPRFPLSSSETSGGADAGDVVHQPADMSAVITSVLRASANPGSALSGLVNPREVGAAGHSNGAITTLGLVTNTCCRDTRVKAAVVMAGAAESFPGGHYDISEAPPLLLVHGTSDQIVPYAGAVAIFNNARGPKGLLSVKGGGHDAAAALTSSSAGSVERTTTDFFNAYLRGDRTALARIGSDGERGVTKVTFDAKKGSQATLPTIPTVKHHLTATATPTTGLTSGSAVTVTWRGYTAGKVVNVLQCLPGVLHSLSASACSFTSAKLLVPDPNGSGTVQLHVVEGTVGTGTCDPSHPKCVVVVNNASSETAATSVTIPISFGS
jgi:alpha-beta hydrolase superfamily lysophospholipase